MKILIYILGILQILSGIAVMFGPNSAIHEILATTAFGFGVLALGFGAVLGRLDRRTEADGIRIAPANAPVTPPAAKQFDYGHDPKLR
ncbi:hypothetical protein [Phyllobacterium bourgognense]|uniref:Uncharacterized protein n=1 Tax=Phyllobacterium bourgognense TaxID=314236 RepID=A0A368YP80_9HYPH|nr:hypothetical protein [Phyllobacterium bourgognense]RCW82023.1 hypothetical protein C7476_109205 [Phyllobacterium bourgognense]